MIDADIDSSQFWGLVQAMSYKERTRHLKRAMGASARMLRNRAAEILLSRLHEVRDTSAMKKTIWTKVYSRMAGFRVTVAGNKHCYPSRMTNSRGGVREVPLGRWLEDGTKDRVTRKNGAYRGNLSALSFLGDANEELKDTISGSLEENFMNELIKTARKYGCI